MRKDLLYAAGKEVVKDRTQDRLNAFFTMSLRNCKFEILCCATCLVHSHVQQNQIYTCSDIPSQ